MSDSHFVERRQQERPVNYDRRVVSITDERRQDLGPPAGMADRRTRTKSGLTATDAIKMRCPHCGHSFSAVVRVRGLIVDDAVHRRRECASCGKRFPTKERVDYECLTREETGPVDVPAPAPAAGKPVNATRLRLVA